jgi:hypothetical protein
MWTTAAKLRDVEFPELEWAIPNILPAGTALLSGPPKVGKSMFAINVAVAIATGGKVFGTFDVEQGTALYVPMEDGGLRRVKDRIEKHLQGEDWPESLLLTDQLPRFDDGGLDELDYQMEKAGDCRVCIIDTLQTVRPEAKRGATPYQADYDALKGVAQLATKHNLPVMVLHHNREMAATNFIDKVSGSRGLTAVVDTVLVADWGTGDAEIVLKATGRDIPESEYAFDIDFDTLTWRFLGDAETAQMPPTRRAIVTTLTEADGPLGPTEIAKRAGLEVNTVKSSVLRMVTDRVIRAKGDGTYEAHGGSS